MTIAVTRFCEVQATVIWHRTIGVTGAGGVADINVDACVGVGKDFGDVGAIDIEGL